MSKGTKLRSVIKSWVWPHLHVPALLIIPLSLQHSLLLLLLQLVFLNLFSTITGFNLHRKLRVYFFLWANREDPKHMRTAQPAESTLFYSLNYALVYLVLQPVPPSLQVHVFSVWIIETAFTQFTVKPYHFSILVTHLKNDRCFMWKAQILTVLVRTKNSKFQFQVFYISREIKRPVVGKKTSLFCWNLS